MFTKSRQSRPRRQRIVRQSRLAQRGAIMVEVVVVLVVLLLILIGIQHFRSLMRARLAVLHGAQTRAWALAYSNDGSCFKNKAPWSGFTSGEADTDPASADPITSSLAESYESSARTSLFQYAHADVYYPVAGPLQHPNFPRSAAPVSLRARTYITCDELVPEAPNSDQNVISPIGDFIRSLWSAL